VVAIAVVLCSGWSEAQNRVLNPSFESGGTTPTSWAWSSSMRWDKTFPAADGVASIKAYTTTAKQLGPISQTVSSLIVGKNYKVSVRINGLSVPSGAVVFDTNDKYDDTCQFAPSATSGWVTYQGGFKATATQLTLRMFTTPDYVGTAYFDDVKVMTNNAPVASDLNVTTAQGVPVGITLAATDPDGDAFSYEISITPYQGTLSGTAPNLTYTPGPSLTNDRFTYTVKDSYGAVSSNITVTITKYNNPPVDKDQSVITAQGVPVGIELKAWDPDGDSLSYTITTAPARGTLSGTAPNLTYTPGAGFNAANDTFTYIVTDSRGAVSSNITVTITRFNNAPVAIDQNVATAQGVPVGITLAATDPDGDSLSYTITTAPARGTLSGTAPNLTYTPSAGFSTANDTFTYTATDSRGAVSRVITVTITRSSTTIGVFGAVPRKITTPLG